jgi:ATP-dependent DNA ligase
MPYAFSFPTKATRCALHEISSYRIMLLRERNRVRLISGGAHDWARHFPLIVAAALKLRQEHIMIDGGLSCAAGRRFRLRRSAFARVLQGGAVLCL